MSMQKYNVDYFTHNPHKKTKQKKTPADIIQCWNTMFTHGLKLITRQISFIIDLHI